MRLGRALGLVQERCPEELARRYGRATAFAIGYISEVNRAIDAQFPALVLDDEGKQAIVDRRVARRISQGLDVRQEVHHHIARVRALVDELRGLSPGYAEMVTDLRIDSKLTDLIDIVDAWY